MEKQSNGIHILFTPQKLTCGLWDAFFASCTLVKNNLDIGLLVEAKTSYLVLLLRFKTQKMSGDFKL